MQVNKMSKSKKRICIGVAVSLFILGLIAGIYVMSRNKIQVEVGESNGEIALACFKQVAGDSYVEEIASLKEAKETDNPLRYLTENSTYVLDEEAIEIYVESYITAAESTAQATGVSVEKLIVDTWGYESIDAYREEAKLLANTFIKERLVIYELAKDKKIKISTQEYEEQLGSYAINFGYATAEEFVYACMPVSIANEMLYDKVLENIVGK